MELTLKDDSVYTFKTTGGEEIVAKVVKSYLEGDFIEIVNPVSVGHHGQGMGLMPSLFTADSDKPVKLNTKNVLMVAETDDAIVTKYIELTTGIKVPEKKIVLG